MPRCLVLFASSQISGLTPLCHQLVGGLVASGCDVSVALAKRSSGFPSYQMVEEAYPATSGTLEMVWLPEGIYQLPQRQDLVWAIEKQHDRSPLDLIIALGGRSGFSATVAGQLCDTPVAAYITYKDVFETHFRESQELDTISRHAAVLFSCNPQVLEHVSVFHDVDHKLRLMDSRPAVGVLPNEIKRSASATESDTIVTTGTLNGLIRFEDLLQRVLAHFENGATRWVHAGFCKADTLVKIDRHLVTLGLPDRFQVKESMTRSQYQQLLLDARCHLAPAGERDTNLGIYESQAWGVPVDLPAGFPFPNWNDDAAFAASKFAFVQPAELLATLPI